MKLVFVNATHPEIPHVSGMRVPYLGRELSRRGHQVLLITPTLSGDDRASLESQQLEESIARHDWSVPLLVAVPPRRDAALRAVRTGVLPVAARRVVTFYYQLVHLGVFDDFVSAFDPYLDPISASWVPDLVWSTFGDTSCLKLAQRVARRSGAPWVIDFKDSWREFVHPWLRRYLAARFRDASAGTANAEFTWSAASPWFGSLDVSLIYSGVADAFFSSDPVGGSEPAKELVLIGGIYDESRLREFLAALQAWLDTSPPSGAERMRLTYLGTDAAKVRRVVDDVQLSCEVDVQAFVDLAEMARRCRGALACCYIKSDWTFHHKLLELLVSGRPVICYPAESEESLRLSRSFRAPLLSCASAGALQEAFSRAWQLRGQPRAVSQREPWSWGFRAGELEAVFEAILARRHSRDETGRPRSGW